MNELTKRIRFNGFDLEIDGGEYVFKGRNNIIRLKKEAIKHSVYYEGSTRVLLLSDKWSFLCSQGEMKVTLN